MINLHYRPFVNNLNFYILDIHGLKNYIIFKNYIFK